MTLFRESFATQQSLPPWEARGVQSWCFLFPLSATAIQRYLDEYFNFAHPEPAPFRFSALAEAQFGCLTISYYPVIASTNKANMLRYGPQTTSWDHLSYNEMYVAAPVLCNRVTPDNLLVDRQIVWIQPVVMCDNSSVVFATREIVGIDTMHATINLRPGRAPGSLHVDTQFSGFKTFSPTTAEGPLPFLHLETGSPLPGGLPEAATREDKAFLEGLFGVIGGVDLVGGVRPTTTRLISLKQFRDAYDLRLATYQAIVASTATHTDVSDLRFFDPKEVDLDFMWSASAEQILSSFLQLGRPGDEKASAPHEGPGWDLVGRQVKIKVAFAYTNNAVYDQIETLHTFGAE